MKIVANLLNYLHLRNSFRKNFILLLKRFARRTAFESQGTETFHDDADMANGTVKLIDQSIKEQLLHYPTVELIRRMYPDVKMHGRSVLHNPLREDKNASLSCFRDRSGMPRWKDHSTGDSGDNIDFFRLAYPDLGYVDAIDQMARLILGRSALQEGIPGGMTIAKPAVRVHRKAVEPAMTLRVVSVYSFTKENVPEELIRYTRERGISDEVSSRIFSFVRYVNTHIEGKTIIDKMSGLPVIDKSGNIAKEDGMFEAVGLMNDIGGYALRAPEGPNSEGFKGTNTSFISTILAGGTRPADIVTFHGEGDGYVSGFHYNPDYKYLAVSPTQGFLNVEPWVVRFALPFLDPWVGRYMEGKDLRGLCSVLSSMNGPVARRVTIVEGMYDGASVLELDRMSGPAGAFGGDLVVLNSVSNLQWAVPFLAMHGEVRSLLDNDMRSAAGQKAYNVLLDSVSSFAQRAGVGTMVWSDSGSFAPCKDVNDYLIKRKGFPVKDTKPERNRKQNEKKTPGNTSNTIKP